MLINQQCHICCVAAAARQSQADAVTTGVNIVKILYSIGIVSAMYTLLFLYDLYALVSNTKYCYRWETLQASYWYSIPHTCIIAVPYLGLLLLKKPGTSQDKKHHSGKRKQYELVGWKLYRSKRTAAAGAGDFHNHETTVAVTTSNNTSSLPVTNETEAIGKV